MKTQEQKVRKALRKLHNAQYPDDADSGTSNREKLGAFQIDELCTKYPKLCTGILARRVK